MLLHYLVNALSVSCTWNRWPSAPRNTKFYSTGPVTSKYARSEPSQLQDLGYHATSCLTDKSLQRVWTAGNRRPVCGPWTVDYQHGYWPLVEDFERASIQKEDNLNTICELTILILSVSVNFSVSFVWLLPCYIFEIFHSKRVPATSTIKPTRVFVLQGSAAAKSGYGGRFYSTFWHRYLLTYRKNIKIGQQLPNVIGAHFFDLQFHMYDALSAFTR